MVKVMYNEKLVYKVALTCAAYLTGIDILENITEFDFQNTNVVI